MICNPCNWPVGKGGSTENYKTFTYPEQPQSILYHFSPHDSGLCDSHACSIIFFANSPINAERILEDMLKTRIKSYKGNTSRTRDREVSFAETLLENKNKWVIIPAPMNQFYKVGWAWNDTIL